MDRVKDCVIVLIVKFLEGYPRAGGGMERGCEIVLIELSPAFDTAKFELARCLVKKVGQGQRLCNCVNSQTLEGYPQARGGWRGRFVKLF